MTGRQGTKRPGARAGSARSALQLSAPFLAFTDRDETTVRTFLNRYRSHLRLNELDQELSLTRTDADELGHRHYRYTQCYAGLPVWPADVLVQHQTKTPAWPADGSNGPHSSGATAAIIRPSVSVRDFNRNCDFVSVSGYPAGSRKLPSLQVGWFRTAKPSHLAAKRLHLRLPISSNACNLGAVCPSGPWLGRWYSEPLPDAARVVAV